MTKLKLAVVCYLCTYYLQFFQQFLSFELCSAYSFVILLKIILYHSDTIAIPLGFQLLIILLSNHLLLPLNYRTLKYLSSTSWYFTFSPPYIRRNHTVISTTFAINHSFSFSLDLKHTSSSSLFHHTPPQILTGLITQTPG